MVKLYHIHGGTDDILEKRKLKRNPYLLHLELRKMSFSTVYYTDIGYLIYKLLYDANIFFGFIITYTALSEANIIRYGTHISDTIYFEILEISCNYPTL